jgi:aspartate/methionine/tyrosine aminotransferase
MPPAGDGSLTAALASEMRTLYGKDGQAADIQPADVAITAGCNMAYSAAIMTLCDAGDEVILPVPWYFNHQYVTCVQFVGYELISLALQDDQ